MHPFCVIGEAGEYSRPVPLCPWKDEGHIQYYVPVDNTQHAFDEFEVQLNRWSAIPNGQTVLVCGEAGCGKTSLIHRCAFVYQKRVLACSKTSVAIIDLTQESWAAQAADSKAVSAIDAVLYRLSTVDGFLPTAALDQLTKMGPNSPHIRTELSTTLQKHSCVLMLLMPPIETKAELDRFTATLALQNTALLLETSSEDVSRHCRNAHRPNSQRPVLHLSVGPLSEDDGWSFVQRRLELDQSGASLTFEQESLRRYVRERKAGGGSVSVWGLERLCYLLYEEQRGNGIVITYDAIANLFVRRGEIR